MWEGWSPPGSWRFLGLCKDEDISKFFPTRETNPQTIQKAKLICKECPVLLECREYALDSSPSLSGIWGGLTQHERRKLNNERDLARAKRMGLR
jgi:WhiB family redox-sensing transcriptional regulator